jgi:hypothetical protein
LLSRKCIVALEDADAVIEEGGDLGRREIVAAACRKRLLMTHDNAGITWETFDRKAEMWMEQGCILLEVVNFSHIVSYTVFRWRTVVGAI